MNVLSLFSGIGGLDLGLERAGMTVVAQCEVDPYCCRVLAKHWPHVPNLGDVTTIDWSTVPDVDLICGGYPCQPFSLAGRRQGADDVRHLWPYVLDAVRHLRPSWVLLENVPGHLSLGFGRVLGDLAESGYDAEWDCIPAAAVGAPHRRDRVFIVAYPSGGGRHERSDGGDPQARRLPVAVGGGGRVLADADGGRFSIEQEPDSGPTEPRVFASRRGDAARRRGPGRGGWPAEPRRGSSGSWGSLSGGPIARTRQRRSPPGRRTRRPPHHGGRSMTRPALFLAALLAFTASACTPAMQDAWRAMSPAERDAYVRYVDGGSVDCYQALDRHWPAASRQWARDIVWRESRNIPTAANPSSTARGCGQLLLSLHGWRFTAVGCSPAQWADPDCNVKAMLHLYREAGTSPWSL